MKLKNFFAPTIVITSVSIFAFIPTTKILAQAVCNDVDYTEEFNSTSTQFNNVTGDITIENGKLNIDHSSPYNNFSGTYNSYALTNYNVELQGDWTNELTWSGSGIGASNGSKLDYGFLLKSTKPDVNGKLKMYRFTISAPGSLKTRIISVEEIGDQIKLITTKSTAGSAMFIKAEKIGDVISFYFGTTNSLELLTQVPSLSDGYQLGIFSSFETPTISSYADVRFEKFHSVNCSTVLVPETDTGKVYRFFNYRTGAHLYTTSIIERDTVRNFVDQWLYEGEKYSVELTNEPTTIPVHRFWQSAIGSHLYVTSETEKDTIMANLPVYKYEGVKFYVYETQVTDSKPVYRFFNTQNGAHLYTDSETEKQTIISTLPKFSFEGTKFYVLN
jgi:hypothetical protein